MGGRGGLQGGWVADVSSRGGNMVERVAQWHTPVMTNDSVGFDIDTEWV